LVQRLGQVVSANTNTLRLIHAENRTAVVKADEILQLLSSLRGSSASSAEHVADKIDIAIEVLRDLRADARQLLQETRATNESLGVTQEEISQFRRDQTPTHPPAYTPALGVPVYIPPPPPLLPPAKVENDSPPDGITIAKGKIKGSVDLSWLWTGVKKIGPWLGIPGGAAVWHFIRHLFGM
jgi:hypothetical protein